MCREQIVPVVAPSWARRLQSGSDWFLAAAQNPKIKTPHFLHRHVSISSAKPSSCCTLKAEVQPSEAAAAGAEAAVPAAEHLAAEVKLQAALWSLARRRPIEMCILEESRETMRVGERGRSARLGPGRM